MEIKKSGIKNAGLGVFTTMAFKSGATFGPYAGEKVRADIPKVGLDTSYWWEVSASYSRAGEDSCAGINHELQNIFQTEPLNL